MTCALKAKGVFAIASGSRPKPADDADADPAAIEKWEKGDAIAMFTITAAMGVKQITLIESCTSSVEVLSKLDSIYQQKSDFNKMLLLDKFHQLKMDLNESVVEYIARVENLALQIKNSGEKLTDMTLITKVLSTLPVKYRNFRQAWLSMDESKQTLSNLIARLIDEEKSIEDGEKDETAFVANFNRPTGSRYQPPNPSMNRGRVDKSRITCYCCRKKGHFANECNSRNQRRNPRQNHRGGPGPSREPSNHNAFSAEVDDVTNTKGHWILDSGASAHMTHNRDSLCNFLKLDGQDTIHLGDNTELPIEGKGDVKIMKFISNTWTEGLITNVLYVPGLKRNLFSEGTVTSKGMKINKTGDSAFIYNNNDELIATGVRTSNNLYKMLFKTIPIEANVAISFKVWHERLGHLNLKSLKAMSEKGMIEKVDFEGMDNFVCEGCQYGKQHRLTFSDRINRASKPGELIHSDLCGPMSTSSLGGSYYFVLFKDDFSGFVSVEFLKHKCDTLA